jgi:hypothetical protein
VSVLLCRNGQSEYTPQLAAGMPWGATHLQIDTDSRTNLLGAKGLADAGALPTPFAWRMQGNSCCRSMPPPCRRWRRQPGLTAGWPA